MAKFGGGMDQDLLKMFETLEKDTDKMLSDMVSAGAEVVKTNCEAKMPRELKKAVDSQIKVSKVYKTPSDDGINQQVMISGYFINRKGEVTPAPLVANMFEYGSSSRKYPKKPFFRACFNKSQIEKAMLKVQEKYIKES